MNCPLCGDSRSTVVGTRDRHRRPLTSLACLGCGLVRIDPLPSLEELHRFYRHQYRLQYKGVDTPKPKHIFRAGQLAAARLHLLRPFLPPQASVLDVGAGAGEWLYILRAAGFTVTGIEPSLGYSDFARRQLGVDVRTITLWEADFPPASFDVVTLFHVLEHLPNPVAALRRCLRWIRPGALLVVEVPNLACPLQHPAKRFHAAHLLGFNSESLRLAVEFAGLTDVSVTAPADGRNLLALARLAEPARPAVPTYQPLPEVSVLGYYLQPNTYLRFAARMRQFAAEWLGTLGAPNAAAILNRFIQAA